ncbi:hypothetical protein [Flavobacterium muglaense]|uniref:Uncharacterized protein n=1 Tax=Flavobacterium muglaense TaxID=2764716 RepID=A0A923N3Y4_9FLAO|nr:hypothetical protein [Flavobacterium muglaense]MBC5838668.1 hypothetical protein [Flavobacterium muglaense]MBC5845198.1 hypothetical protein [Flavobacterium muglaense]
MINTIKQSVVISLLFLVNCFSQNVEKIEIKGNTHFITTKINYPITGTYLFEGAKEPIMQLNPNGTGIYQLTDLTKQSIVWGMECLENGTPKYQKGFNYATYSLWYKTEGDDQEWTYAHFSIHFQKKKMFIMGERVKEYQE